MSNIKKVLLATVLLGLVGMAIMAFWVYRAVFMPNTAFSNEEAYVYIGSHDTFGEVREQLVPLIKDMGTFEQVAAKKGYVGNIKAGKYAIKKGSNNNEIVNSLRSGNIPVRVSFNNQESVADLAGRISQQLEADSLSLLNAFNDADFLQQNGLGVNTKLAIYLPNTYEFYWNTDAETFRDRMLTEYQRFWTPERKAQAQEWGLTPLEVITLASIVQKETAKVDERPRVAGVYLNRLKQHIALQADPTVIFAMKLRDGDFTKVYKRVLYKDLELDSPYNTYKYAGLPPGPIAMPDISSIEAVLHAEKHDYLYFVANVERFGYHKFAKTLMQHNRNKEQYIRWLNEQQIKR